MAEETSDAMNLDLHLGPVPEAPSGLAPNEALHEERWNRNDYPIETIREVVRVRARQRRRWRQLQMSREPQNLLVDLNHLIGNPGHVSPLHTGEGSVAAEERTVEVPKTCESNNGFLQDVVSDKKDGVEKGNDNDGSFFDCNICLDLATDPVVTCCGHLFCWPCLYQWLHVHSDAKECPVCKGEVTTKNVIPIYGRGSSVRELKEFAGLEIPHRPGASGVESVRQTIQRNPFGFPVVEMVRRLGRRVDSIVARETTDLSPPRNSVVARETADRTQDFLNRIMTLRGMRSETNPIAPPDDIVDLAERGLISAEPEPPRRFHTLLVRRSLSNWQRSSTSSAFSSPERLVDAYVGSSPLIRSQGPAQPLDDRDSFSSIAAVINPESQMDTAVEIDSMFSLSTSSRRTDASRVSDGVSEGSRAPRRRRLN